MVHDFIYLKGTVQREKTWAESTVSYKKSVNTVIIGKIPFRTLNDLPRESKKIRFQHLMVPTKLIMLDSLLREVEAALSEPYGPDKKAGTPARKTVK